MADSTNDTTAGGPATAGALLRAAREKQGLHIAALAAAIKVAPRKLDALENDRWHELPDATFTRALAQTVCRTLKIDAAPVLALLPATNTQSLEPSGQRLNEPFRERPSADEAGFGTAAIRPMVWAAVVLMAAALGVYLMPAGLWTGGAASVVPPPTGPAGGASAPLPALQPAVPAAEPASGALPPPPTAGETVYLAPATPVAAPLPATPEASAGPMARASEAAPTAPPPAAPAAAGLVQLRSSEAAWVEARDAQGQLLLSRTVLPGESVGLNGALPIRLTVGNAAGVELRFRGQPVDVMARARDNVARLELQ